MYYAVIRTKELQHHGIKGMKWGKRNGPPYPLGESDHSASEKKAGWKKSLKKTNKYSDKDERTKDDRFALTDKQKKALKIGAAVVGVALVSYGAYKLRGKIISSDVYRGNRLGPGGVNLIVGDHSDLDDLSEVNPTLFMKKSILFRHNAINGSDSNCMLCTTAYELRRRGYDVHAGFSTEGFPYEECKKWFLDSDKNYRTYSLKKMNGGVEFGKESIYDFIDTVSKEGDQRGNIMVQWSLGGGHSMIYEVKDGKMRILDGQVNKVYDNPYDILKIANLDKGFTLFRTDNLEINPKLLDMKDNSSLINKRTTLKTITDNGAEVTKNVITSPLSKTAIITGGTIAYKRSEKNGD